MADELGLGGFVSRSIEGAAESPNRWYALLIGVPILLWVTRSLLRVLIGAHRLVWGEVRAVAPKATPAATADRRREALAILDAAATTFGSSAVLEYERNTHRAALGLPISEPSLAPRTAWEHYTLGRALMASNDLSRAADQFKAALALDPVPGPDELLAFTGNAAAAAAAAA